MTSMRVMAMVLAMLFLNYVSCLEPIHLSFIMKSYKERPQLFKAAQLGADYINNRDDILPGAEIQFNTVDLSLSLDNMKMMAEKMAEFPTFAGYVGPFASGTGLTMGSFTSALEVPYISGTCTSPALADEDEYPFFSRTSASGVFYSDALASMIIDAGWKRVAFFCLDTGYGNGLTTAVKDKLIAAESVQVIDYVTHPERSVTEEEEFIAIVDERLEHLRSLGSRVILYHGYEGTVVLQRAMAKGMLGPQSDGTTYQWLLGDAMCKTTNIATINAQCSSDECKAQLPALRKAMRGTVCANVAIKKDEAWQANWDSLTGEGQLTAEEISITGLTSWAGASMYAYNIFFYDAVLAYGHAIHAVCTKDLAIYGDYASCYKDLRNKGADIMRELKDVEFDGASGHVQFLEDLDRAVVLDLVSYQVNEDDETDYGFEAYGSYTPPGLLAIPTDNPISITGTATYANLKSTPPPTMEIVELSSTFQSAIYGGIVFAWFLTAAGMVMAFKQKKALRGSVFLSFKTLLCLTTALCIWFTVFMLSYAEMINPSSDLVAFSFILEASNRIFLTVVLSILFSRVYRFYLVSTNSKLRQLTFSKLHQLYTLIILLIPSLIVFGVRLSPAFFDDDKELDQIYTLQDTDDKKYFTMPAMYYDELLNTKSYIAWSQTALGICLMCLVASIGIFASRSCTPSIIRQKPLAVKELRTISKATIAYGLVLFVEVLYAYALRNGTLDKTKVSYLGFDNGYTGMDGDSIRLFFTLKIITGFGGFFAGVYAFEHHYWNKLVSNTVLKRTLASRSNVKNSASTTNTRTQNRKSVYATAESAFELTLELASRLKQVVGDSVTINSSAFTTDGSFVEKHVVTPKRQSADGGNSGATPAVSSSKVFPAMSANMASSSHAKSTNGGVISYSQVHKPGEQSQGEGSFVIASNVIKAPLEGPSASSYDADSVEAFKEDLKTMNPESIKKMTSNLKIEVAKIMDRMTTFGDRIIKIDINLAAKTAEWEILQIRQKRLNGVYSIV
eukprot:TRINITY_DN5324_c0_g2_i1.p1 TRINITY_DN5324_c0_g2~~TRINITY_DN5324_c0_g2_i1.p1  ORF type:complete len:1015 (+),score=337.81 TRINITY_DN5324_c0_g2_i1:47-3091(+)